MVAASVIMGLFMPSIQVQVSAARTDKSLVPTLGKLRHGQERMDFAQKLSVRLIEQAVQDAKKTMYGNPTDVALLSMWWIKDHRPARTEKDEWERSFERACVLMDVDVDSMRARLVTSIEAKWREDNETAAQAYIYVRRAMVLACAGIPTAIARQYLLGVVNEAEYDDVAGVDHGDLFARRTVERAA